MGQKADAKGVACPRIRLRAELGARDTRGRAAPPPPVLSGTNPASPANANSVFVFGTAEAGSTVSVYPDANCSGPPYPPGSAASFASPGLQVQVPDDSTTTFSATAEDASSNVSACSAPISLRGGLAPAAHLHQAAPFQSGQGDGDPGVQQ